MFFIHKYNMNKELIIKNKRLTLQNTLIIISILIKDKILLLKKRFIMYSSLQELLLDYFPDIRFFDVNYAEETDILIYAREIGGAWSFDLNGMSQSDEFRHLFHSDFLKHWNKVNEAKAIKEYGRPDIIRFCIDIENEKYWQEFSALYPGIKFKFDKGVIREHFIKELRKSFNNDLSVWALKDSNFDDFVYEKTADNIFEAFKVKYYGIYTQLNWGVIKLGASDKFTFDEYLEAGKKHLDDIVIANINEFSEDERQQQNYFYYKTFKEQPEKNDNKKIDELKDNWERDRAVFAQEILEMVPDGISEYCPKTEDDYVRQLKGQKPFFIKRDHNIFSLPLTKNDMQNLKNYLKYIKGYGGYIPVDFFNSAKSTKAKVEFLMDQLPRTSVGKPFSEKQRANIEKWHYKLDYLESIDKPIFNKENKESGTIGAFIEEEKYRKPGITNEDLLDSFIDNIKEYFVVKHREGKKKKTSAHLIQKFMDELDNIFILFSESPNINLLPGTREYTNLKDLFIYESCKIIVDEINF